jgi:hypothetical protein
MGKTTTDKEPRYNKDGTIDRRTTHSGRPKGTTTGKTTMQIGVHYPIDKVKALTPELNNITEPKELEAARVKAMRVIILGYLDSLK